MRRLQRGFSILLVLLLFFVSIGDMVFADELPVEKTQWQSMYKVPSDKVFTIRFSEEIDVDRMTLDNVTVTDEQGNQALIDVRKGDRADELKVYPPLSGYYSKRSYLLRIDDMWSKSGKRLRRPVEMNFTVADKEPIRSEIRFQDSVQALDQKVETSQVDGQVVMDLQTAEKQQIAPGKIIVQEATAENPFGFVGKVEKVRHENGKAIIETSIPKYEEVYENIDISGSIDLFENAIIEPRASEAEIPYTMEEYFDAEQGEHKRRLVYHVDRRNVSLEKHHFPLDVDSSWGTIESRSFKIPHRKYDIAGTIAIENLSVDTTIQSKENIFGWEKMSVFDFTLNGDLICNLSFKATVTSEDDIGIGIGDTDINFNPNPNEEQKGELDLVKLKAPLGPTGLAVGLDIGVFAMAKIEGSLGFDVKTTTNFAIGFGKNSKGKFEPIKNIKSGFLDPTDHLKVNGEVAAEAGVGMNLGLNVHFVDSSIAKVGFEGEAGPYSWFKGSVTDDLKIPGILDDIYLGGGIGFRGEIKAVGEIFDGVIGIERKIISGEKSLLEKSFQMKSRKEIEIENTDSELSPGDQRRIEVQTVCKYDKTVTTKNIFSKDKKENVDKKIGKEYLREKLVWGKPIRGGMLTAEISPKGVATIDINTGELRLLTPQPKYFTLTVWHEGEKATKVFNGHLSPSVPQPPSPDVNIPNPPHPDPDITDPNTPNPPAPSVADPLETAKILSGDWYGTNTYDGTQARVSHLEIIPIGGWKYRIILTEKMLNETAQGMYSAECIGEYDPDFKELHVTHVRDISSTGVFESQDNTFSDFYLILYERVLSNTNMYYEK